MMVNGMIPATIKALLDKANCLAERKKDVFNLISLVCFLTKQRVTVVMKIQTKAAIDTGNVYETSIFMILNHWAIASPSPETYKPLRTAGKTNLKTSAIDFVFWFLPASPMNSPNLFFGDTLHCYT
ncbi:MAG TPA: hypothetical protein DHV39_14775 [Verrucomicrobiales bacterium]|nr:hypothetical protein [Verrucomicrobiales bacterium]|tara:strand:+ start:421 stop:798 length:378 start_codon:yes stop_codon:yes gene_type:complete